MDRIFENYNIFDYFLIKKFSKKLALIIKNS